MVVTEAVPPLEDMLCRGPVPMRCAGVGALSNLALGCPDKQASAQAVPK